MNTLRFAVLLKLWWVDFDGWSMMNCRNCWQIMYLFIWWMPFWWNELKFQGIFDRNLFTQWVASSAVKERVRALSSVRFDTKIEKPKFHYILKFSFTKLKIIMFSKTNRAQLDSFLTVYACSDDFNYSSLWADNIWSTHTQISEQTIKSQTTFFLIVHESWPLLSVVNNMYIPKIESPIFSFCF